MSFAEEKEENILSINTAHSVEREGLLFVQQKAEIWCVAWGEVGWGAEM